MPTSRVSAIITTWNRSPLLKKAIASVLAQTFTDFELLVLDNGSTDDTPEIVKGFADSRLRYIKHQPLGISAARNLGVREAKGEFVGFLDDDDEWLPEKLARQVALMDERGVSVGMVYGGFYRIRNTGEIYVEFKPRLRGFALTGYLCGRDPLTGSASNPLIRKSVLEKLGGYDERVKTSEDWEFYLRLMREFEVDFVPLPVVNIREHTGARLGDRLKDAAETELTVCEKFEDFFKQNPHCHASYLLAIGGKYCRVGELKEGRKYLRQAIYRAPFYLIPYLQYIFSLLGSSLYRKIHIWYKRLVV